MTRWLAAGVTLLALLIFASSAAAQTTATVQFEAGPPLETAITDQYLASDFVQFFQSDARFRPYRRSAPGLARSGTVVANVGADRCVPEGFQGSDCEQVIGGTFGRLSRTANSVRLYAGLFAEANQPVTARLIAYDAGGTEIVSGAAVPIDHLGFDTEVSVTSPSPNIASFELVPEGTGALGAAVGFDDLTIVYPANSLPDISLTAPPDVIPILQGKTTNVEVDIARLNGSNGDVNMSVTGLPQGVSAQFVPAAVPGTQTETTLQLTAGPNAQPFEQPVNIRIRANPGDDANVAPTERSILRPVRVASNFSLRADAGTTGVVPACTSVDLPFTLARDRAFNGTVTLAAQNVPAGVTAEILPGTSIAPGGGFNVNGVVRLHGSETRPAGGAFTLRATSANAPDRTLGFTAIPANQTATLETVYGLTPRRMGAGTAIRMSGNGFCPGTRVRMGAASADVSVDPGGLGLGFNLPRLAMSGPVTIEPPGTWPDYPANGTLTVDSFRSRDGFQFRNFGFSALSITELTEAFGANDLFIQINPCWPWGDCDVPTGILNPVAAINWGALNLILRGTGGHCFGMSLAVQEIMTGRKSRNALGGGATIFALPDASGPQGDIFNSYLDSRHALQGSLEFLEAYVDRDDSIAAQIDTLRAELAAGRDPIIAIADTTGVGRSGHAMIAYDLEATPDGFDIYLYDNNKPFQPGERSDSNAYRSGELGSVIHVVGSTWTYDLGGTTWSGGNNGTLYVVPTDTIPRDPELPGLTDLDDLLVATFGSADNAVRTVETSDGAEFLPRLDPTQPGGSGGWLVAPARDGALTHTLRGVSGGTYTEAISGPDFVGGVTGVRTGAGVQDEVKGNPKAGTLEFESGRARPLEMQLAASRGGARGSQAGGSAFGATIDTRASKGGSERAGLTPRGRLTYAHDGAATRFSFTLTRAGGDGGATTFRSPVLRIRRGQRLVATPVGTGALRVTLGGSTRVLRGRVARGKARVTLRLRVNGRRVTLRLRVRGVRAQTERAVIGAAVRATSGGRVVATKARAVRNVKNGRRTVRLRLPRLAGGTYRLLADARLVVSGASLSTALASRRTPLRVP